MTEQREKKKCLLSGASPGGPLAKTLRSQYKGPRFDPWSGN